MKGTTAETPAANPAGRIPGTRLLKGRESSQAPPEN